MKSEARNKSSSRCKLRGFLACALLGSQIAYAQIDNTKIEAQGSTVALSKDEYQKTISDIKQIYSASNQKTSDQETSITGSQPSLRLAFLRQENSSFAESQSDGDNQISLAHFFPKGENQGYIIIKTPIKHDDITLLQVPHAFFDLHSLDIAQQMFDTQWVDILMVNTEHRYETKTSDLARLRYSLFTAVVDALLQLNKQAKIVQVHGFNEKKRKSSSAKTTDFILSNGTPVPDTYMLMMQSCLRDNSKLLARLYGRDVFELGATINPVGKLIRNKQPNQLQFLHIEIPRNIRNAFVLGEPAFAGEAPFSANTSREVLKCLLNH